MAFSKNWKQWIVSLGEPFQIEYLTRKFGGRSKTVFKVLDADGTVDMSGSPLAKLPAASFHSYCVLGTNSSVTPNHITAAGVKPGDKVIMVADVTNHLSRLTSFESTVTKAGQIQQSATDLSAATLVVLVLAQS
jgi:hypothetical protein